MLQSLVNCANALVWSRAITAVDRRRTPTMDRIQMSVKSMTSFDGTQALAPPVQLLSWRDISEPVVPESRPSRSISVNCGCTNRLLPHRGSAAAAALLARAWFCWPTVSAKPCATSCLVTCAAARSHGPRRPTHTHTRASRPGGCGSTSKQGGEWRVGGGSSADYTHHFRVSLHHEEKINVATMRGVISCRVCSLPGQTQEILLVRLYAAKGRLSLLASPPHSTAWCGRI